MATILEMLNKVQSFDLENSSGIAMMNNKEQIIALNTNQIYELSQDSNGSALRSPYSKSYTKYKSKITGRTSPTDLYLTGDFQHQFNMRIEGNSYFITSASEHAEYVVKWANAPVYGLTIQSKVEAWNIIAGDVVNDFCYKTGCKRG